jgi:hypothetical protein
MCYNNSSLTPTTKQPKPKLSSRQLSKPKPLLKPKLLKPKLKLLLKPKLLPKLLLPSKLLLLSNLRSMHPMLDFSCPSTLSQISGMARVTLCASMVCQSGGS